MTTPPKGPLRGTAEWHQQRTEELRKIAARNRTRPRPGETERLRALRAELSQLASEVAAGREITVDGEDVAQRMWELEQAIRAEEAVDKSIPPGDTRHPMSTYTHAGTAASARAWDE